MKKRYTSFLTILLFVSILSSNFAYSKNKSKEHNFLLNIKLLEFIEKTTPLRKVISLAQKRGCPKLKVGELSDKKLESWFEKQIHEFKIYTKALKKELFELKSLKKQFQTKTSQEWIPRYLEDGKKTYLFLLQCLRYQNMAVSIERRKENNKKSSRSIKLENACRSIKNVDLARNLISTSKFKNSGKLDTLIVEANDLLKKLKVPYNQDRDHKKLFGELQRAMKIKLLYTLYETKGIVDLPAQKIGNSWVNASNGRAHVTALLNGLEDNVSCGLSHNDYKTFLDPIIENPETAQERLLRIKKAIITLNRKKRKYQLSLMKNVELLKTIEKFHPAGETSVRGSRIRFNTYGDASITVKKDGGLSEMKKFIAKYYPELKEKYPTLTFSNPPPELTKDEIGQTLWEMYRANRHVATYARIELIQGDTKDDYRTKGDVVAILGSELVFPYRPQFQSSRSVWKIVKRFEKNYKKYIHLITKQKEHAREILEAFTELFIEFPELIKANQTFYEAILEIPKHSAIFSLSFYRDFWKNVVVLPTKSEMTESIKERRELILEELTNVCSEEKPEDSGDQKDIMYQWAHHPDILAFIVKYKPNLLERLCRIYKKKQSIDKRNGALMLSMIPIGIVSALAAPVFPITAAIIGAVPVGVGMTITISDVHEYYKNKDLWQLGLIDYQTLKESKERAITSVIIELATLPFAISGLKQSIKEIRAARTFDQLSDGVKGWLKSRRNLKAFKKLMKEFTDAELEAHLENSRMLLAFVDEGMDPKSLALTRSNLSKVLALSDEAIDSNLLVRQMIANQLFDDLLDGVSDPRKIKNLIKINKMLERHTKWRGFKTWFKEYYKEIKRTKGLRIILKDMEKNEDEILSGFFREYAKPEGHRWWKTPFKTVFQAPSRIITKLIKGKPYDLTPFHGVYHTAVRRPLGWTTGRISKIFTGNVNKKELTNLLTIPASFYIWGYMFQKYDDAFVYLKKNKAVTKYKDHYDDLINNDYRYRLLREMLEKGKISKRQAREVAYKQFQAYTNYCEFMNKGFKKLPFKKQLYTLLHHPLFMNIKILVKNGIPMGSPRYRYSKGFTPILTPQKTWKILNIYHHKYHTFDLLAKVIKGAPELSDDIKERYHKAMEESLKAPSDRNSGEFYTIDKFVKHYRAKRFISPMEKFFYAYFGLDKLNKESQKLLQEIFTDHFFRYLFDQYVKNNISKGKLTYFIQEDYDWKMGLFIEQNILKISPYRVFTTQEKKEFLESKKSLTVKEGTEIIELLKKNKKLEKSTKLTLVEQLKKIEKNKDRVKEILKANSKLSETEREEIYYTAMIKKYSTELLSNEMIRLETIQDAHKATKWGRVEGHQKFQEQNRKIISNNFILNPLFEHVENLLTRDMSKGYSYYEYPKKEFDNLDIIFLSKEFKYADGYVRRKSAFVRKLFNHLPETDWEDFITVEKVRKQTKKLIKIKSRERPVETLFEIFFSKAIERNNSKAAKILFRDQYFQSLFLMYLKKYLSKEELISYLQLDYYWKAKFRVNKMLDIKRFRAIKGRKTSKIATLSNVRYKIIPHLRRVHIYPNKEVEIEKFLTQLKLAILNKSHSTLDILELKKRILIGTANPFKIGLSSDGTSIEKRSIEVWSKIESGGSYVEFIAKIKSLIKKMKYRPQKTVGEAVLKYKNRSGNIIHLSFEMGEEDGQLRAIIVHQDLQVKEIIQNFDD